MKSITLPLKKVYFYQILAGEKQFEYRSDTPFFQTRFKDNINKIVFHYYKQDRLECDVLKIDKISNPFINDNLPFLATEKVFRVHLKNPRLVSTQKKMF